jgi:hypothetical protein
MSLDNNSYMIYIIRNPRRVLRSPSAIAGNTMVKRKRAITDLQNIFPTAIYIFTGSKNKICIFWT